MTRSIFAIALVLTACPGPDDTGHDTGPDVKGTITATVMADTTVVDTTVEAVSVDDPSESYVGETGKALKVPNGDWDVYGGDGPLTPDGIPTVEVEGERWVVCPALATVSDGHDLPVELSANRDMKIPNAHCVDDGSFEYAPGTMFVERCSLIDISFFTGREDYLEVKVDELVLVGESVNLGGEISDFWFTSTSFWIEFSDGFELTCD